MARRLATWATAVAVALTVVAAPAVGALPCPPGGGTLRIVLEPAGDTAVTALVAGAVVTRSCERHGAQKRGYIQSITCRPEAPDSCLLTLGGLQPGTWLHRLAVTAGEPVGQSQARAALLLDASAGTHTLSWPLYRSVHTVTSLDDAMGCSGCLRSAITAAESALKPALVQFSADVAGTIVLAAALPPLATGHVTLDALDANGAPWTRIIDGNGLNAAALRITGEGYTIAGLRVIGVGGDSDAVLLDGPLANDNLLDALNVAGRSLAPCGTNAAGCIVDGACMEPSPQNPRGACGDDAVAVRNFAGAGGANRIRNSLISGAHDKGVKASDGGVAIVEDSTVVANSDGGLQATLGGSLTARRNVVFANHGTTSANGIAANGAAIGSEVPAQLVTDGNLSLANALRGISVRSLSQASLHNDFVCGNGTAGRGGGFGVAVLDAAGRSATVSAGGLGIVHNADGGAIVTDNSTASFGTLAAPGANAFAFNGGAAPPNPANFRNDTPFPTAAIGNAWEHCGDGVPCDIAAVQALDVSTSDPTAPVAIDPALPTRPLGQAHIDRIEPPFAAAGAVVRIYGSGFDAIEGAGTSCSAIAAANTCRPLRGNCVFIDRSPAEVVAATPTMLVIRLPSTCVAPVTVSVRAHWGRGFARAPFCTVAGSDSAG